MSNKRVYLDYAATTPVAPEVVEAMLPYFHETFGNPSSIHRFGLEAKAALDQARSTLARALNATPHEIYFTSGGTESNNLAILGRAMQFKQPGHIITSAIEHPSVLQPCKHLQQHGWRVTFLPVDRWGRVDPADLEKAITEDTALISIMYVNNEIGTINPIAKLAEIAAARRIPFHTDAAQAFGKVKIDVRATPISLLSIAGHKIYAPKGVGVLYIKRGVTLSRLLFGGGQENELRPGTENLPGIVGLAKAVELMERQFEAEVQRLEHLAQRFMQRISREIPAAILNGHPQQRLPWVLNYSFPGMDNTSLVMALDLEGVAISNGSAC
ncbi:MAG: cysteine desulfurase, partial [Calditrichaeota bacterium]